MAQLIFWGQGTWIGDMAPGDGHPWIAFNGLQYGDVVDIMAHPVVGDPTAQERILQVEDIQAEGTSDGGRRIFFTVRNAGPEWIPGYAMTFMILRP